MIVEMLADAILEVIRSSESVMTDPLAVVPEIHIAAADSQEPVEIDGLVVDNDLKRKIQQRVQEGIWEMYHPTILH